MSSDTQSLTESAAKLALGDAGGSGYNQFASARPARTEGTLVDAGVHGMKRSWDGFKLEMKFGECEDRLGLYTAVADLLLPSQALTR